MIKLKRVEETIVAFPVKDISYNHLKERLSDGRADLAWCHYKNMLRTDAHFDKCKYLVVSDRFEVVFVESLSDYEEI